MKKDLFKVRLFSLAGLFGFMLTLASCANEEVVQKVTNTDNDNIKNLTTFSTGNPESRTSMDYSTGNFYWEAGDYIYVQDDDNVWQQSSNAPTERTASFMFRVPGKFINSSTYKVYYPGKNGTNDQVTIPATQIQTTPNSTAHFGISGDCGVATAYKRLTASGTIEFSFHIDHQAAYLVFLPYTNNTILRDCYLTKIEVNSDNDITDTYTLDPTTGTLNGGSGIGKQIVLTTKGSGTYANGFPLTNASANIATNGAFMIVKPGTHTFKIRYWVKDLVTNVEGTITKLISSRNFVKNKYYNILANLDPRNYDGDHYYQWDAQQQFWYGYEWWHNNPTWQPTLAYKSSNFYPKDKHSSPTRWFNETWLGSYVRNDAQTAYFKTIPNANEMAWYVKKGDPRWDADEIWTTMGHVYKGGLWLKKKSHINGYSTEHIPDGTNDLRKNPQLVYNYNISKDLPSASEANQFFYLPTLGNYNGFSGVLEGLGKYGNYWSSNAYPVSFPDSGFSLYFDDRGLNFSFVLRRHGLRSQPFSDFGDN